MKTEAQIKQELENVFDRMGRSEAKEYNKLVKEKEFLTLCKIYMESGPSEAFLKREEERLTESVRILMDRFEPNESIPMKDETARRKAYEKESGVEKSRTHLKTLKYLLS